MKKFILFPVCLVVVVALLVGAKFPFVTFTGGFAAQGATPVMNEVVSVPKQPLPQSQHRLEALPSPSNSKMLLCTDDAGTTTRTLGNGSPAPTDAIICYGDSYTILHNGNANFSGDGDPLTQPGLDLMIFTAPPTNSGPLVSDIQNNIGYTGDLVGTDALGNITFSNMGTYQSFYNANNPIILWFAPVTLDDVTSTPKTLSEDVGGANECVNVNVNDVFSIVFLNDITIANFNTPAGGNLCQASLNVRGGFPQWNGSNYTLSVELSTNPSVTGTISTSNHTHNTLVIFTVPQPGLYNFNVSDANGCTKTFQLDMSACVACTDDAGSATVTTSPASSTTNPAYLCFGDTINVVHNGDQDLGGDPNPLTNSGIQYVIYTCQPTATGHTLNNILNDPCIVTDNTGTVPQLVGNTDISGNTTIPNNGLFYQGFLTNAGLSPLDTLWFAPITVDGFPPATWEGVNGPNECTNVNPAAAFPVVFLNQIMVGNITNNFNGNACQGTVDISGGLPEADGSNYVITVELLSNPSITGTIVTPATHGGTAVFQVPQPGNYQVTVSDGNGCTAPVGFVGMSGCPLPCSNFTLTGGISSNYNGANISCSGGSNGEITAVLSGGTFPYTYTWSHDNTLNDSVATNLTIGTYHLTITDNDGCVLTNSYTLTAPSPLFVGVIGNNPLCAGENTGIVYVGNIGGGTAPYSFSWSNGVIGTADTIFNLTAGGYALTVTDANGCTAQASTTLGDPQPLDYNFTSVSDATCSDVADGTATVTPSGGTIPYNYTWQHDATLNTATANNLGVGVYYATVTDNNGCTFADSVTINATLTITATSVATDVSCFNGNDGTITVTPVTNGGAPNLPYTFAWSPNNTQNTNNVTTLTAGNYYYTVSDAVGCLYADSATVNQPDSIVITVVNVTDVLCNGATTGSITVSASGGTFPYTYDWGGGNTDSTLANAAAGIHTVTVTDANNCSHTRSITIIQPTSISISNAAATPVTCNGFADGSLSITATGGSGNFSYAWSSNPTTDTLATVSNLAAGTYFVTISDASSCVLIDTFTLTEPSPLTVNLSGTNQTCFNVNDGTVLATPSGGTTPHAFVWSNGATTASLSALLAGSYAVTVTDANGCNTTNSITITAPPAITTSITATPVTCQGGVDGTATVTATGGSGGFSYLWSNTQTNMTATQMGAGVYFVTVTDLANCTVSDTTTIVELPPLNPAGGVFASPVTCFGGNDGYIQVNGVTGGTMPYSYQWSTSPPQDSSTAINLTAGSYSLIITDANGCIFGPVNVTVNQPAAALTATTSTINPSCNGENDGSISVIPTGGTASYTYLWSDGQTSQTAFDLSAGTYNVSVTDANGCTTSTSGTLSQPAPLNAQLSTDPTSCSGSKDGRILVDTVYGGEAPYAYSIDGINYQPTNIIFFGLLAGNYNVSLQDANGCLFQQTVLVEEPPLITVNLGSDYEIELGNTTTLEAIVNTLNPLTYTWTTSPADTSMSCTDCPEPTVAPVRTTIYTVIVEDSTGCTATDAIVISVDKNRNIFIPSGFTPDGDGRNDKFIVFGGVGVVQIRTFTVFDRWGEVIFSATNFQPNDASNGWDGYFRGNRVSPGVYVYYVEVEFADGLIFPYKGDVTLLR